MIYSEQISTSDTECLLRQDTRQTEERVVTYLETARCIRTYTWYVCIAMYKMCYRQVIYQDFTPRKANNVSQDRIKMC